ncbi:uncharacterized protein LOC144629891 [Oculina patagonica]
MATGSSTSKILFMPTTLPGPPTAPTILSAPSAATGPVSSFDLIDNQKRWVVIGVCLNRLLLPVLRDFAGREISKHYASLKSSKGIDSQVFGPHLTHDGTFKLSYGSIHNNWGTHKRKERLYDYKVTTDVELAQLYLEPHMAKFTGFDNTCDMSAVLGILANASVFPARIQNNAKDVRSKVRNEWGHCNFDYWTKSEFNYCFQLMETLVRSLGLPKADEDKELDDLHDWETKGLKLCMGCPVDKDLMKLVSDEVTNLNQDLEAIKKSSADEAKKISEALQDVADEINNFDKRITDIESRMEAERKEQSEKNEALSGAIGYISNNLTKIEKRQDTNQENIALLGGRQKDLETSVTSLKDEQGNQTSKVEALEIGQNQFDSRLKALEESNINATADVEIFQVPSRNRCFCGRETELEKIATQLKSTENGCAESAIYGLGGVGKTSLAVEFLWRQKEKEEYPGGIFWISGENNNLFQISLSDMARQIGTFEKEFSTSLSRTLDWLGKREKMWCLVVDNLDELEMSTDMRKLLTGHWKQAARGHIIITTRREATEVGEETGIEENFCVELKCLTEKEGIQFLRMRTGTAGDEDSDIRELVRELGGLPLALDQAAAYIRCVRQPIKEYLKKYNKQKLLLLKKKKARHLVENTSPERLAIHTTWLLNFDRISQIAKEMELGETPTLVMKVSAFLGPDDIPYEVINEGLNKDADTEAVSDLWDQAEIASLLTKFSLFQRYGAHSFSVHRLVQEVVRNEMEKEQSEFRVLSCAVRVLHHALANTRSPAEVCESFVEDAVFSVENPPSLQLWGKLASHASYLQEHLRTFSEKHKESVHTLLYTEETVRIFNEAAIFFSVSKEKVKAQAMQEMKLEFLVHLEKSTSGEDSSLPPYFIDVPLKDRDYKVVSFCMRQPPSEHEELAEADSYQNEREEEAEQLREKGNLAVKSNMFKEALDLYSSAIALSSGDYRLFCNRALCHLKLDQPLNALDDCQKCLSLEPYYSKALQRKAWALQELVKSGSDHLKGQARAALAVAVHFDSSLRCDKRFCEMFPELSTVRTREITNETQLKFALMTTKENETMLLHEGEYNLAFFGTFTDVQIVGLGPRRSVLICAQGCGVARARCYFENITFPKGNVPLVCDGKEGAIHLYHCEISGGMTSCDDYPECNGGSGCIAASLGKPVCDRTGKFGDSASRSGIGGFPGIQIANGSSAMIENCVIHDCGGGGALVAGEGSRLLVKKCEVYRNHQAGLEAREGGELVASENTIFNGGYHGILIGPDAGECDINGNKIFENAREGILAVQNKTKIVIQNNDIHHNRPFGLSLDVNSHLLISNNKIFENGFWGILAHTRTSAHITSNVLTGNKCGGIYIGVNFSGRVHLESNIVRDHSGPWLECDDIKGSLPIDSRLLGSYSPSSLFYVPPGEKNELYSNPPILDGNKEFNNKEGMYHPREVVERLYSGCTYCRRSRDKVQRLIMCPNCHIAAYCCKECQYNHRPKHKTLCSALKSRYSVTVDFIPHEEIGKCVVEIFGAHLKGIGKGPKLKRNSHQKFIVKVQTQSLNSHPLQLLNVYDQSRTIDCFIQSPEIFSVIMECGVLGGLTRLATKKVYFWAIFAEGGRKLSVFLDHLAPYQCEW